MLSYMLPVEDKSCSSSPAPVARNLNLSLNLNTSTPLAGLTVTNGGSMGAQTGLNGNSLVDVTSTSSSAACDESTKLLSSERAHILKTSPLRDLKLDNGIIKMPQTQKKPPLPPPEGDTEASSGDGGGGGGGGECGGGGGGTTTEDSSCCDTDSKSALSGSKKGSGKLNKAGTKNVTLKRVSFGSSKGSMVETLVFETPTPLPEHAEREFGFPAENFATSTPPPPSSHHHLQQHHHHHQSQSYHPAQYGVGGVGAGGAYVGKMMINNNNNYNHSNNNNSSCMDDSGIEMQEELERSKVRVTFFQSSKPQQVSPPESYINYTDNSSLPLLLDSFSIDTSTLLSESNNMTAATATQPSYDRQISTESGWDNPFRPGGDLSREADEIVNMIKGGKPITPTGDAGHSIANGNAQKDTGNHAIENGSVVDGATKTEVSHVQSTPAQNGTKSPQQKTAASQANGDAKTQQLSSGGAPQTQVSNQVIPGPISASHVVIEDKKKKKCTCCVIQ